MNQPDPATPAVDFDGCHRACRTTQKHTLQWGDCEHAAPPAPTVSMSRVYTDHDGQPSIGFDVYTVPQLAELIEPALRSINIRIGPNALALLERGEEVRLSVGEYASMALAAADTIVHRNEAAPAAAGAAPATDQTDETMRLDSAWGVCADCGAAAGPDCDCPPLADQPAADQTGLRDRIAEALIRWSYRGQDPDPETGILDTVRANAYSRADAILVVLGDQQAAIRAAALREGADALEAIPLSGVEAGVRNALTAKLRRMAAGAQQQPAAGGEEDTHV
ncbi:hypothetical protein [Streptomyces griseosporeus]